MKLLNRKTFAFIISAVFLFSAHGCCRCRFFVIPPLSHSTDKNVRCGVLEGFEWWNYYEAAISFADSAYWKEAEAYFHEAIRLKPDDERRARTYGRHYLDYFPNRELGIMHFYQGRIREAIALLVISLNDDRTHKAEVYLNRARKKEVSINDMDSRYPEIHAAFPEDNEMTNQFSVEVAGMVKDDTYVRFVTVDDRNIPISVAEPEIVFNETVSLYPGENTVHITAEDIVGNRQVRSLSITVDRTGPVISLEKPEKNSDILKGYVLDDLAGIKYVKIGNNYLDCRGTSFFPIQIPLTYSGEEITVKAGDHAGNETSARINLKESEILKTKNSILLAQIGRDSVGYLSLKNYQFQHGRDIRPPEIELKDLENQKLETYLNIIYLQGKIRDTLSHIEEVVISIDGKQKEIPIHPGNEVYFNHIAEIHKTGEHIIEVKAKDSADNLGINRISVLKMISKVKSPESRLKLGISAFKTLGEERVISLPFERKLYKAVGKKMMKIYSVNDMPAEEIRRFFPVDLNEDKSEKHDFIFSGEITENTNTIGFPHYVNIEAWLQDDDGKRYMEGIDVYGEEVDMMKLEKMAEGLVIRLANRLPLIEGVVKKPGVKKILADFGKRNKSVKNGMKVIVYHSEEHAYPKEWVHGTIFNTDPNEIEIKVNNEGGKYINSENSIITR